MNILGTRFGELTFEVEDVITLPDGLIGFSALRSFILISHNPNSPFRWLQSLDEAALAFLVADPTKYFSDYMPEIDDSSASALDLSADLPALVYTTASIPKGKPEELTLNLAAPIIINARSRTGKQIVLENEAYTMRHRVFQENSISEKTAA